MAGLQGLPAMGALYCRGASWSQWRPLDIPDTHLPYSTMQLLMYYKINEFVSKAQNLVSAIAGVCNSGGHFFQ